MQEITEMIRSTKYTLRKTCAISHLFAKIAHYNKRLWMMKADANRKHKTQ